MLSKVQSRLLMLVLFVAIASTSKAQEFYDKALSLETWYNGELVLRSGEMEKGSINFNYVLDMVQVKQAGRISTYNKSQIESFRIYPDAENDRERNYKSLNLPIGYRIYEVIAEDSEKAFLASTQVDEKAQTYFMPMGGPSFGATSLVPNTYFIEMRSEDYYLINRRGEIDYFGRILFRRNNKGQASSEINRKQTLKKLKEFDPNLDQYLKDNNLNIREHDDLLQIIRHIMNLG